MHISITNLKNPYGFFSWLRSDDLRNSEDSDESSRGSGLMTLTNIKKGKVPILPLAIFQRGPDETDIRGEEGAGAEYRHRSP